MSEYSVSVCANNEVASKRHMEDDDSDYDIKDHIIKRKRTKFEYSVYRPMTLLEHYGYINKQMITESMF